MKRILFSVLALWASNGFADMSTMHKDAFVPVFSAGFTHLEWQKHPQHEEMLAWDFYASLRTGNDVWMLKSKGEADSEETEKSEVQALYLLPVSAFWNVQLGLHSQQEPNQQQYALVGIQGLAPYYIEMNHYLLLGADGDAIANIEFEYEWLLVQNWELSTEASFVFNAQNDSEAFTGSGFSRSEQEMRLGWHRYRLWVPYVGVVWEQFHGKTADIRDALDMPEQEWRGVVGMNIWF